MHVSMWSDMFHLGLPIAEKIIRSVVIYAFLIVGLRLAGKRELAQLNPFDLIVLLTLSTQSRTPSLETTIRSPAESSARQHCYSSITSSCASCIAIRKWMRRLKAAPTC